MAKRMYYVEEGALRGYTPTGVYITVRHLQRGKSGFEIEWNGERLKWAQDGRIEEELGVPVYHKQNGSQTGYPSEAGLRAPWRYLVDRYNEYDPDIELLSL